MIIWILLFLAILLVIGIVFWFGNFCGIERMEQGIELKYHNVGKMKYEFEMTPKWNVGGATSIVYADRMLVTTKAGKLLAVDDGGGIREVFDAKRGIEEFTDEGEGGLLYVAKRPSDGVIHLSYTVKGNKMNLVVSQFDLVTMSMGRQIVNIGFRETYHHSGAMVFDDDDNLYLATGDGGPQGDPYNEAQNKNSYVGKILKIDKAGNVNIIALGLRNPWGISIDYSGRLFVPNTGWNSVESVYLIDNFNKIYNFGWSYFEGSKRIKDGLSIYDPPIFEYPHTGDNIAIVGGFFVPEFSLFVFADYGGRVRGIETQSDMKWIEVANTKFDSYINNIMYTNGNIYALKNDQIYQININEL